MLEMTNAEWESINGSLDCAQKQVVNFKLYSDEHCKTTTLWYAKLLLSLTCFEWAKDIMGEIKKGLLTICADDLTWLSEDVAYAATCVNSVKKFWEESQPLELDTVIVLKHLKDVDNVLTQITERGINMKDDKKMVDGYIGEIDTDRLFGNIGGAIGYLQEISEKYSGTHDRLRIVNESIWRTPDGECTVTDMYICGREIETDVNEEGCE